MCAVEWCNNKPHPSGKGYCRRHYDQIRKCGKILETRTILDPNDIIILDNRKKNLRFCSHAQNCWNRPSKKRGVRRVKGRNLTKPYYVTIVINGETKFLGYFKTEEEALKARDEAERIYHGEFKCMI